MTGSERGVRIGADDTQCTHDKARIIEGNVGKELVSESEDGMGAEGRDGG